VDALGCWLSGVDVTTESLHQEYQDPWLALVVRLPVDECSCVARRGGALVDSIPGRSQANNLCWQGYDRCFSHVPEGFSLVVTVAFTPFLRLH